MKTRKRKTTTRNRAKRKPKKRKKKRNEFPRNHSLHPDAVAASSKSSGRLVLAGRKLLLDLALFWAQLQSEGLKGSRENSSPVAGRSHFPLRARRRDSRLLAG